ncbi:MAG: glycosyltransferase, partial [Planctomycetota bacterium]|nr:glycosyltransferase [Planctomycetota bacterium]
LRHMARYLLKPLYASAQPPPGEMGAFVPPRRDLAAGQARVREDLAERYLSGVGIEVGARQRPLPVPPAAKVRYVDALTKEEAQRRFPELSGMTLVDPEIIDNGQALAAIADGSLDFCIQNHVLEHMRNPVGALRNWLRILKAGGAAYVAVPDRSNTLDRGRPVATLEHLLLDDQQLDRAACDRGHYVEWAVHVNGCERGPAAEARAAELEALDCGIHFHVFDEALFRETLAEACRAQHAEVCEFVRHDELGAAEFIAIVRKLPPPEQLRRPVSIVMPVYNAYEKTVRACETVLQHARDDWELVVVDDASPDQRVAAYLRVLPAREKRVRVLTNGANAGFVITANRGMREARADCDILLLNSDVEVTEGFLRRIQDTAFATADTGVVTPFSNNATIYSVPTAGEDKPLPPGFSADDMQRVVVSGSLRGNPEIPTAVGFCMYIRREVLSRVGLFDEVSYGRGFGEENDLCERAKRAGFKVRLCDSQFIYHAGKSSFGAEGNALSQRHAAILEAKQPGYHAAVARFCAGDPLRRTRLAINAHLRRWPHRHTPAPMFLLHADPFRAAAGGTEAHVLDRVANLGFKRALIVYPNAPDSIEAAEVLDGAVHDPLVFRFPLRHVLMPYAHHDAEAEDILLWITRLFGVRALCFDHLLAWPLHAVRQLHAAGLPYLCVTHDFYAVCPSLNLLNAANWRPCAVHFGGGGDAEACLREHFKAYRMRPPCDFGSLLARHRALFTAILQNAERVVFPSDSSRKTVTDAYPLDASRAVVIPHGYKQSAAIPPRPARGRRLKVALIGAVAFPIKGSDIVVELMRLTTSLPLEWHVFGDADAFDFRARVLRTGARVVFHGAYARENIIPMLVSKGMDAALFTSVCPETFAFTLSEAWCAGVPPIVPRLGALSERVEATGIGWIVEPHSAPAIMKLLQRLAAEPAAVEDMRRKLRSFVHTSVQENAAAYRRLLEPLVNRVASVPEPPSHLLSRAIQRAPVFTGNRT